MRLKLLKKENQYGVEKMKLSSVIKYIETTINNTGLSIISYNNPTKFCITIHSFTISTSFEINPYDDFKEVIDLAGKKIGIALTLQCLDIEYDYLIETQEGYQMGAWFMDWDKNLFQIRNGKRIKIDKEF